MDTTVHDPGASATAGTAHPARRWVLGLVLWSLFVWATRIDNIVTDDTLDGAARAWRLALALSFVLPALTVAAAWWRRPSGSVAVPAAVALAIWTIVVWIARGVGIAFGDHTTAFIVVHLVLAAVSIALAAAVLRVLPGGLAFMVRRPRH